jgi:hypothetical protein
MHAKNVKEEKKNESKKADYNIGDNNDHSDSECVVVLCFT